MTSASEPVLAVARRPAAVEATRQLADLLNRIGHALVAMDAAVLLAAEVEVGPAVAAIGAVTDVGDRAETLAAARLALAALLRCRRLGASFSGVAHAVARVGRAADGYDRAGGYIERASVRPSVQIRA